jgi:uncharacterized protein YeaO (DUF488 family)
MEKIVYTKSIIKDREPDEKRISVMSRHTEADGVTPDERIVAGINFDEWLKELAPPAVLVGAYYRKELSWEDFADKYLAFLRSDGMRPKVEQLAARCSEETLTLLCIEDTADKCHRRLLVEELTKYQPHLRIIHK